MERLKASLALASPFWAVATLFWVIGHWSAVPELFNDKAILLSVIGLGAAWLESLMFDEKHGF